MHAIHSTESIDIVSLVVNTSASREENPGFDSRLCHKDSSGYSHTSELKFDTPVTTLPGALRYRISAGNGWPSACILRLGEVERSICNFYLSVAARTLV